jgi:hypothetical protein
MSELPMPRVTLAHDDEAFRSDLEAAPLQQEALIRAEITADAFLARVAAEDAAFMAASQRIARPLMDRITRSPDRAPRHDQMAAFVRAWVTDLPQEFSLDIETSLKRNSVDVTEYRLGVATVTDAGDSARQVVVGGVRVRFSRHDASVRHHVHGLVSRAALLARCKAGATDVAAVIRALAVIRDHDPAAVPEGAPARLPAEGGAWIASAMEVAHAAAGKTARVISVIGWTAE